MKKVYPHDQKHNRWPQTLKKIGFAAFFVKPHPRFSKQKSRNGRCSCRPDLYGQAANKSRGLNNGGSLMIIQLRRL